MQGNTSVNWLFSQWARKAKLYDVKDLDLEINGLDGEALSAAWNDWIRVEEKKR